LGITCILTYYLQIKWFESQLKRDHVVGKNNVELDRGLASSHKKLI